jgi:hypothetical protein
MDPAVGKEHVDAPRVHALVVLDVGHGVIDRAKAVLESVFFTSGADRAGPRVAAPSRWDRVDSRGRGLRVQPIRRGSTGPERIVDQIVR